MLFLLDVSLPYSRVDGNLLKPFWAQLGSQHDLLLLCKDEGEKDGDSAA